MRRCVKVYLTFISLYHPLLPLTHRFNLLLSLSLSLTHIQELGLVGFQIGTHINQWNLDAPELFPIFQVRSLSLSRTHTTAQSHNLITHMYSLHSHTPSLSFTVHTHVHISKHVHSRTYRITHVPTHFERHTLARTKALTEKTSHSLSHPQEAEALGACVFVHPWDMMSKGVGMWGLWEMCMREGEKEREKESWWGRKRKRRGRNWEWCTWRRGRWVSNERARERER